MVKKVVPVELSDWSRQSITLDIQDLEYMYGHKLMQLDVDRIVSRAVSVYTTDLKNTNLIKKNAHMRSMYY